MISFVGSKIIFFFLLWPELWNYTHDLIFHFTPRHIYIRPIINYLYIMKPLNIDLTKIKLFKINLTFIPKEIYAIKEIVKEI